jgi:hypothetical protein
MAFKPIYGYSGDHPVLNYAGTTPVCMNPYAYSFNVYINNGCGVTGHTGEIQAISTGVYVGGMAGAVWIPMLYAGTGTLSFTLTASSILAAYNVFSASVGLYFGDPFDGGTLISSVLLGYSTQPQQWFPLSASLDVPYYRYRLYVVLTGNVDPNEYPGNVVPAGEWIKLSIG